MYEGLKLKLASQLNFLVENGVLSEGKAVGLYNNLKRLEFYCQDSEFYDKACSSVVQMLNKGVIGAEELYLQFNESVPITREALQHLLIQQAGSSVTYSNVHHKLSNGELKSKDIVPDLVYKVYLHISSKYNNRY